MPPLAGNWRTPSFVDLQTSCGGTARDSADAQPVYATLYDAYVAKRYRGLTDANYCAFERTFDAHAAPDAAARAGWIAYFNGARARRPSAGGRRSIRRAAADAAGGAVRSGMVWFYE